MRDRHGTAQWNRHNEVITVIPYGPADPIRIPCTPPRDPIVQTLAAAGWRLRYLPDDTETALVLHGGGTVKVVQTPHPAGQLAQLREWRAQHGDRCSYVHRQDDRVVFRVLLDPGRRPSEDNTVDLAAHDPNGTLAARAEAETYSTLTGYVRVPKLAQLLDACMADTALWTDDDYAA